MFQFKILFNMAKVYLMYENYKIDCTDPIGKGVFGEVYHCEPRVPRPDLPSHLAAKKIDISSEMDLSDLNEIKILAQMSHPNIIKFYDVVLTLKSIFVILEYADKGDLAKYVSESPGQRIPESDALLFLKQIAAGLYYTSSVNKVIHRDLKPANILISEDRKIKIADFGFARLVQGKKKMTKAIGSIFYMAPEVFNGKPYDFKCDVWSVGIMIYEFVYGCAPWVTGLEDPEHFKYIQDNPMVNFPEKKSICPTENFKDLIRKMLVYDPDKRIDWEQILNHKALKEHIEVEAKSYMKDILFNMMIVLSGKYDKFNVSFRQIYQMLSFLQNLVMTLTSTTATNTTVEKIFSIIWIFKTYYIYSFSVLWNISIFHTV